MLAASDSAAAFATAAATSAVSALSNSTSSAGTGSSSSVLSAPRGAPVKHSRCCEDSKT